MTAKALNKNIETTKITNTLSEIPVVSVLILDSLNEHAKASSTKSHEISNLLNLSSADLDRLKKGVRDLTLKEIYILCSHYKVDIDTLYEEVLLKCNNPIKSLS